MAIQLSSPQADADAPPSCNAEPELVHRDRALMSLDSHARLRVAERAALYRRCDPLFADWARGLPAIEYSDLIPGNQLIDSCCTAAIPVWGGP